MCKVSLTILWPGSQGFVDTAHLKAALTDAQAEAETCLASLGGEGSTREMDELRVQLREARDTANSCLLQMSVAAPTDEVRSELHDEITSLRKAI